MTVVNFRKSFLTSSQFNLTVITLSISILFAGTLRHHFRENALLPHRINMKRNTEIYLQKVEQAKKNYGVKDYKYE